MAICKRTMLLLRWLALLFSGVDKEFCLFSQSYSPQTSPS